MKCSFCGERVKSGEELCPNCGKYIFETETTLSVKEIEDNAERIKTVEENGERCENSLRFNYSEYIRGAIVLNALLFLSFLACAILVFLNIIEAEYIYAIVPTVAAAIYIYEVVITYKREINCFISINENTVCGTVPAKTSGTETRNFEIDLAEIITINTVNGSKYSGPMVIIETEDKTETLYCSSRKLLTEVSEELEKRIWKS